MSEVALVAPMLVTTRANSAGWRHRPMPLRWSFWAHRRPRTTMATSQGRPAHGSRIAEMRAMYSMT